jgi:hypothetical protein
MGIVATMMVERAVRKGRQPPWIGALTHSATSDAVSYGVVDEIARRVWLSGGRVLAARRDAVPGRNSVAVILHYPL